MAGFQEMRHMICLMLVFDKVDRQLLMEKRVGQKVTGRVQLRRMNGMIGGCERSG